MSGSSLNAIMDFLRLSDRIGTAGQPTAAQIGAIGREGYEVVVNLRPVTDALPNERALVEQQGMVYVSIPVAWEAPTAENVEAFFAAMEANRERRVFVHCARNMRVSAFMYLYRVLKEGASPEAAAEDLHCIWEPNPVWQRLITETLERHGISARPERL